MVVHDPAATEAFDLLADVPGEELNERTLFSAHPDRGKFAAQHAQLVGALWDAGVAVVRLADLIGGSEAWSGASMTAVVLCSSASAREPPWRAFAF